MRLVYLMAARPTVVKMAQSWAPLRERLAQRADCTVHTDQHHDRAASGLMLEQLRMPPHDHLLGVGSPTQAVQTAH